MFLLLIVFLCFACTCVSVWLSAYLPAYPLLVKLPCSCVFPTSYAISWYPQPTHYSPQANTPQRKWPRSSTRCTLYDCDDRRSGPTAAHQQRKCSDAMTAAGVAAGIAGIAAATATNNSNSCAGQRSFQHARNNICSQAGSPARGVYTEGREIGGRLHCWLLLWKDWLHCWFFFWYLRKGWLHCWSFFFIPQRKGWLHCWFFLCLPRLPLIERSFFAALPPGGSCPMKKIKNKK